MLRQEHRRGAVQLDRARRRRRPGQRSTRVDTSGHRHLGGKRRRRPAGGDAETCERDPGAGPALPDWTKTRLSCSASTTTGTGWKPGSFSSRQLRRRPGCSPTATTSSCATARASPAPCGSTTGPRHTGVAGVPWRCAATAPRPAITASVKQVDARLGLLVAVTTLRAPAGRSEPDPLWRTRSLRANVAAYSRGVRCPRPVWCRWRL